MRCVGCAGSGMAGTVGFASTYFHVVFEMSQSLKKPLNLSVLVQGYCRSVCFFIFPFS